MFGLFKKKDENAVKKAVSDSINPITFAEVRSVYERPRSFTDLLPYNDFDDENKTVQLEDGISVGAVFDLIPVGSEARPVSYMLQLRDNLQNVLSAIPEDPYSPWVLQFYVNDEPHLTGYYEEVERYVKERAKGTEYTNTYLHELKSHMDNISRTGGLFVDTAVTGQPWRGQIRKIRAVLYHRITANSKKRLRITPEEELNDVCDKFTNALYSAGVLAVRGDGEYFYNWMTKWFNPNPRTTDGDLEELLKVAPYESTNELPFGPDLAESMILRRPRSDNDTGIWWFDDMPHMCLTVQGLRSIPEIGHLTSERSIGENQCTLMDQMPEGTTLAITIVISTQDEVKTHLERIRRASVGDSADAELAKEEAIISMREIAKNNSLYKTLINVYIRGKDEKDLKMQVTRLNSIMVSNRLQVIDEYEDQLALDAYIRSLPMNYVPALDKKRFRSRFMFAKHIANLMPLYGRSRGTGNPGLLFYNRGAEPVSADPMSRKDRKKNGHLLMLGPTGAGKSAQLIYILKHVMAIYRPRLYIIEAGNSFGLLGQYFQAHGLSVNQVTFNMESDISVPPFADAIRLLDKDIDVEEGIDDDEEENIAAKEELDDDEDVQRDILGEMEIAARLMITGGEVKEDDKMSRADKLLIRNSIIGAARAVKEAGGDQVMVGDVVAAMRVIADNEGGKRKERAMEMADGLELFTDGLEGKFFNRRGTPWPESDVTIMEMGLFAREGYEDKLTVAYIGLMNNINNVVEKHQFDDRPTIVVTDEGHIITTNPLLAPYVVKITKMWRKLGAWYWIATQNLEDFPDQSRRMLNMMEWWVCLVMPKQEVEQIARFRSLTDEQISLLQAAKKEPEKYTEGVVMSDNMIALFRSVPPSICLALAMTEKEEKAERADLMKKHNCSELEAALMVAAKIDKKRGIY